MTFTHLACSKCDATYPKGKILNLCVCGAPLLARYDLQAAAKDMRPGHLELREKTLWRYKEVLPDENPEHRLCLGEGMTPLLETPALGRAIGLPGALVKEEDRKSVV